MDPARIELVSAWLLKAWRDLAAARLLSPRSELRDPALFHCQQAGEKAIKGLLVFVDIPFAKTHDIAALIRVAAKWQPELAAWEEVGESLSQYAVTARYPHIEGFDANDAMLQEALEDAEGLLRQVLACLPTEVHPEGSTQGLVAPSPTELGRERTP